MKVIYGEPTICERLDCIIADASKPIKEIRLTASELSEFCEETGYAFAKGAGYTHRGYRIAYDWGSYK